MQQQNWLPWIDWAVCTGCGKCVAACPTGALALRDGKAAVVRAQACTYAAACEAACPEAAIGLPYQVVMGPGTKAETRS